MVYEATQLSLRRTVALKVLASALSSDVTFRARFRREGEIQAGVDHPNIVTVYEAGETESDLFIAMSLVRGPNLKDMITEEVLDPKRMLSILTPIASALDAAHSAGLIHRDVKPQNILVSADDNAYLADFGLTKALDKTDLTEADHFMGTLHYVAPEQIQGESATGESDLYSLSAVLYECLTGVVPYPRNSEAAVLYAHLSAPVPRVTDWRPELPRSIDGVIEKGMAKDPTDRYAAGRELLEEARESLRGGSHERITARKMAVGSASSTTVRDDPLHELLPHGSAGRGAGSKTSARSRLPLARAQIILAVALLAAAGVVGFLTGRPGSRQEVAGPNFASAGGLELSFPDGWIRQETPPGISGLRFKDPIALSHGSSVNLVAGQLRTSAPSLLPQGFVRRLTGGPPAQNDPVRLGEMAAYRYRNVPPKGFSGALTLYVAPTSHGVATVACTSNVPRSNAILSECERVATSLKLTAGKAVPLGPDRNYAERLGTAIKVLNAARGTGRTRLLQAGNALGQARVAEALAVSYRSAEREISGVQVQPVVRRIHVAILTALSRASSAYIQMASAARRLDRDKYRAAEDAIRKSEQTLRQSIARLKPFGYTPR